MKLAGIQLLRPISIKSRLISALVARNRELFVPRKKSKYLIKLKLHLIVISVLCVHEENNERTINKMANLKTMSRVNMMRAHIIASRKVAGRKDQ